MTKFNRSWVISGAAVIVTLVALGGYLDSQKKQQIARARSDFFSTCSQKSYALLEYTQEREVSAVVEKAGLDPNLFRLGLINPGDGHAALEKAGLLGEFAAAVERQKKMLRNSEQQQAQCEKKRVAAKDFLQRNNALPTSPLN